MNFLLGEQHWISRVELAPAMAADDLHVWRATLDLPGSFLADLRELLTDDECKRADRFLVESARRSFVAGRGALRIVLGHYVNLDLRQIPFQCSERGKPFLLSSSSPGSVRFNLSHSGTSALIAVARDRDVGVDIELIQDRPDLYGTAAGFFSAAEGAFLEQLPPAERRSAFYRIWTRKEAVLKAAGQGISTGLRTPDVTDSLNETAAEVFSVDYGGIRWQVQAFQPSPQYEAAVAVELR